MSSPADYIALRAPTYSADPRLGQAIEMAELETGTCFGANRFKAVALLVLHWLTMDDAEISEGKYNSGGILVSEQEGSLKRAYQVDFSLQHRFPDLSRTRWGMELLGLSKKTTLNFFTRRVVVG